MVITYVLVIHILLAAFVLIGFGYRYFQAFKNKTYPKSGIKSLFSGSIALVITGIILSLLSKSPLTSLCLSSLGLITGLIVIEFTLIKTSSLLSHK
jgi:TRAP-type C4-dicarboxylate transport system permease small subunit